MSLQRWNNIVIAEKACDANKPIPNRDKFRVTTAVCNFQCGCCRAENSG